MGSNNQQIIQFFATSVHECSYIKENQARTLFADPSAELDVAIYSALSQKGFRRSGSHVYRPYCDSCKKCIATRLPVAQFKPTRSQRRNLKRNADLRVEVVRDISDERFYQLYEKYVNTRHKDGDMYPASREQYDSFLSSEWGATRYAVFYEPTQNQAPSTNTAANSDDTVIGVAVFDEIADGLSAIYTFYDPDQDHRGLGNYAVLWQIYSAKQLGIEYVYLGYWIKECQKMSYKIKFRPIELFIDERWVAMT